MPGNITTNTISVSPTANTTYTLTGNNGGCSSNAVATVSVTNTPTLSITGNQSICSGHTTTLTATGAANYTWMPGNITTNTISVSPAANTTYTLTGMNNACFSATVATVSVSPSPTVSISGNLSICSGNGTLLTASGATSYTWMPGAMTTSTVNVSPLNNTTYTLTGANGGCSSSVVATLTVTNTPTLTIAGNQNVCTGNSTALTASGAATYTWEPGNITTNVITVTTPTISASYTLTGQNGSCFTTTLVTVSILPTPTVAISGNLYICRGNTTTLTASGATNYTWTPTGAQSNTISVTPAANTTYNVAGETAGCIGHAVATVTVIGTPTLSITGNQTICSGNSATLTASGAFTYVWMPGGSTDTTISLNPITTTVYTLTGTNGNCGSSSITTTITVNPTPTLSVSDKTICFGQNAVLTASVISGNAGQISYTWSPGGGSAQSFTVSPAITTTYVVSIQNNTGCTQVVQADAVVSVYPYPTISFFAQDDTTCKGIPTAITVNITGSGGPEFNYNWNTGHTGPTVTVSPSATTIYSVTANNGLCAPITATTQVSVYPNPALKISSSPTSGCGSLCVSFAGSAANLTGNNITSPYNWNFGDGNSAIGTNVGHCYTKPGNYNVTLSATTAKNCPDSLEKVNFVHVFAFPKAGFSASAFETDLNNATINFYNTSSKDVTHWYWHTDASNYYNENPSHTYNLEGTYPVTLIVKDSAGCSDTITRNITIKQDFSFFAPNSFSPNGDGVNDYFLPLGMGWDNTTYNLWIYDRWGNLAFYTNDPQQGWDGTIQGNGKTVQEDLYIWKVKLRDIYNQRHEYQGNVSILK